VPKWSASASGDYEWPLFGNTSAFAGATCSFTGTRRSDFDSQIGQITLPSYANIDLRVGVAFSHWSVRLYAKNVSDARGISDLDRNFALYGGGLTADGGHSLVLIRPRTVGIAFGGQLLMREDMQQNRFCDKVAMITGGASGIGLATARLFRSEGARLVIVDRDVDRLEEARCELGDGVLHWRRISAPP